MTIGMVPHSTTVQVGPPVSDAGSEVSDRDGNGVDESLTESAAIIRGMRTNEPVFKRNLLKKQTFRAPTYVQDEDIQQRQGERLAAEMTVYVDSWTESGMNYLKAIADQCRAAAARHYKAQLWFSAKHKTLVVPNITFSAIAASTAAIGATNGNNVANGATIVLSTLAAIIGGISNLHEHNIRSAQHGTTAVRFGGLATHIDGLQHLHEEQRRPYEVELTFVAMTLAGVCQEEPMLPPGDAKRTWLHKLCICF
jgi:hypothetical protein